MFSFFGRQRFALRYEFVSLAGFVAEVFHPGFPGFQESPEHLNFSTEMFGFPAGVCSSGSPWCVAPFSCISFRVSLP